MKVNDVLRWGMSGRYDCPANVSEGLGGTSAEAIFVCNIVSNNFMPYRYGNWRLPMPYLHDEEGKEDWDGQDWADEITHPKSIREVNAEEAMDDTQVELDPDGYVLDWKSISNRRRAQKDYTCEECKVRLHDQLKLLHVHHIDKDKLDNSPQNLRVLCAICHSHCEGHEHLADTISLRERTFIELRRALQQKLPANKKNPLPYKEVVPGPNPEEPLQQLTSSAPSGLNRKEIKKFWHAGYFVTARYWKGTFRAKGVSTSEKRSINVEGVSIPDVIRKITVRIDTDLTERLPERHKVYMDRNGWAYQGIRKSSTATRRRTHCYACKSKLDNAVDIECVSCGWIICRVCAACGCGYSGRAGY